ncbi:hypothetical protein [Enterobacter bugandensis]|uniref:hypothetical protein n=1 Tax=Enterobacter bugandensis TaxID=881260 RepID=UPI000F820F8D|nr:hypothetical protein [Enterobacter bugandensis]RTM20124.1 hypothetical protein EKO15_13110 [Enterobacter bugandensis]
MFFNTTLFVGIPSNQTATNAGPVGVITAFNSQNGENENIISITAKGENEQDTKLRAQYLIKLKNQTIWVWIGEKANPIEGTLLDVKIHSDLSSGVMSDKIEVIFKTSF